MNLLKMLFGRRIGFKNCQEINMDGNVFEGMHINGNNITINNGKIIVDGVEYKHSSGRPVIINHIHVDGNVEKLDVGQGNVYITGSTGSAKSSQGSIEIGGDVHGDVKTSQGNIDVEGSVAGSATTSMGNVTIKNRG